MDLEEAGMLTTALALSGEEYKGNVLTIERAEGRKPSKAEAGGKKGGEGQKLYGDEKGALEHVHFMYRYRRSPQYMYFVIIFEYEEHILLVWVVL